MMTYLPLAALLLAIPVTLSAQTVVEVWAAEDAPAASVSNILGNTYDGEIMGARFYDYVVPGVTGKTLSVNLLPMGEVAFEIRGSDTAAEPLYDSTLSGPDAALTLPADDVYTVHVFQTGEGATTEGFATFLITLGLY